VNAQMPGGRQLPSDSQYSIASKSVSES
jgi:hypothetical protein